MMMTTMMEIFLYIQEKIYNFLLDSGTLTVYNIDIYYDTLWKFYLKNTLTGMLKQELLN